MRWDAKDYHRAPRPKCSIKAIFDFSAIVSELPLPESARACGIIEVGKQTQLRGGAYTSTTRLPTIYQGESFVGLSQDARVAQTHPDILSINVDYDSLQRYSLTPLRRLVHHRRRLLQPGRHFWRPRTVPLLRPALHLLPIAARMRDALARNDALAPLRPRLERRVRRAQNMLPDVVEAVLRVVRAVVPGHNDGADVVQAVQLVPHGDAEGEVHLPEVDVPARGRADGVPLGPGLHSGERKVLGVVAEGHVDGAEVSDGELAWVVVAEVR